MLTFGTGAKHTQTGYRDLITRPGEVKVDTKGTNTKRCQSATHNAEERARFEEMAILRGLEEQKSRRLEEEKRKEYRKELDKQSLDHKMREYHSRVQTLQDEREKHVGFNIGGYHSDSRHLADDWKRAVTEKSLRKEHDARLKLHEREELDARHSKADLQDKEANNASHRAYKKQLDDQIELERQLRRSPSVGGVSLQFGADYRIDKAKYKSELDQQVKDKNRLKNQKKASELQEDIDRIHRHQSAVLKDAREEERRAKSSYRSQLDIQTDWNSRLTEDKRRKDFEEEKNAQGLNIGNYHPNYKNLLKEVWGKQLAEKRLSEDLAKKEKQAEQLLRLRNHPSEYLGRSELFEPQLTYKEELDIQNKHLRDLKEHNRVQNLEEERAITGLPLGKYSPNYKQELRDGLQSQIQSNRRSREHEAAERRKLEQEYLRKVNEIHGNYSAQEIFDDTNRYRSDLKSQIDYNSKLKEEEKRSEKELERASQGLPLGNYKPNYREEWKKGLDAQVDEKRLRKEYERKQEKEDERRRNASLDVVGVRFDDEEGERASFARELGEQVKEREARRRREVAEEKEMERNASGLKIGDYVPYDKNELKNVLQLQMKHNKHRKDAESVEKLQDEKNRLSVFNSQGQDADWNDPTVDQYRRDLAEQIEGNSKLRNQRKMQERIEEQYARGLPLGLYSPNYKDELKKGLDSQLLEKDLRKKREQQLTMQEELKILEQQRRNLELNLEDQEGFNPQQEFCKELKEQIKIDQERKNEQREFDRLPDQGLGIGDYKGYDKAALKEGLQRQIEEKRDRSRRERQDSLRRSHPGLPYSEVLMDGEDISTRNEFRRGLDEQVRENSRRKADLERLEREEERAATSLKLGNYHPNYRDQLRRDLRTMIDENETSKKQSKAEELIADKERLRLSNEEYERANQAINDPNYYNKLNEQIVHNRELNSQRRRRDLEDLASDMGMSLGDYKGHDKDEFRRYLDEQIASKEQTYAKNGVRNLTYLSFLRMQRSLIS